MQIALRERNLDPGFAKFFFDGEVEIAFKPARTMAHLGAPNDELEIDGALAELLQENARRRFFEDMRITASGRDQGISHLMHVAAVSDADRDAETHPRIAVSPV